MSQRLRKIMSLGAAVVVLAAAQPAAAGLGIVCLDLRGDWEVGAQALYLTPITCRYTFAMSNPNQFGTANTTTLSNAYGVKCGADWGFRVFGKYIRPCSFLGVSYQWGQWKNANQIDGTNIAVLGTPFAANAPVRARGDTRIEYQNVDVRWGGNLHRTSALNLYVFGNARWVDLSYRRSAQLVNLNNGQYQQLTAKSELHGGAIGIGAGAEFQLGCGFGLFGESNMLGVIADRNLSARATAANNAVVVVRYGSETCISPEATFRSGLNYEWTCDCFTLVGEVGYELDYLWDGALFPQLLQNGFGVLLPGTTAMTYVTACQNVGFSGLFFGAKLLF